MPDGGTISLGKIDRNLRGLAEALFDEIDAMRAGTGSPDRVRQMCAVSGRIITLLNTEMKFRKMAGVLEPNSNRLRQITGPE